MKVIVMLLALLSCVTQADDISTMLDQNVQQQVDVTEVVFVKSSEWNAAIDKIYSECEYIDEDWHDFPAAPYIFQCNDWEVRTDSTMGEDVTLLLIEGFEYVEDNVE